MFQRKLVGTCILAIGIVLLYFGYNQTQSLTGEVREAVSGGYSDETMLYLIVGVVGVVAGLMIVLTSGRR